MDAQRVRSIRPALLLAGCFLLAVFLAGCTRQKTSFSFDWNLFISELRPDAPGLWGYLYITIVVAIVAQAVGVILGIFAALGNMSRFWPFKIIAEAYIWFFRGTPLVVQLMLLFYGFAVVGIYDWPNQYLLGLKIPGELYAAMAILGINEGAYMAEIVRAGIMSVDPGQTEAAKSLGMTYRNTMSRIVLPQAARVIIPPLGNEFNNMLKTTSLIFILGVMETYNHYSALQVSNGHPFEAFIACALWFLLMTTIWSFVQGRIERKFAKGTSSAAQHGPGWRERFFGRTPVGVGVGGH
jgi:polar amino acid transport system permease protein